MVENQNIHFSIIIPTYQEAKNIPGLIQRITHINFEPRQFELIIVDDNSNDGTKEMMGQLMNKYMWLRLIVRNKTKCLSQSVIEGIENAKFPLCVIMDADLSHPPEKIPELLERLQNPHAELVIGSRYIAGGSSDENWPLARKIVSRLAAF
ncbi:MAG TPA: glycosyltransferase, partial [Gammaproteobacteria bacterium]|nr:glycosyltransferase [Gammaproteobacteria bacterium]